MAISTPTNITIDFDNGNRTDYTVLSQTYTSGRLYLLGFFASRTGTTPDVPTLTGTGTWDLITDCIGGASTTKRLFLYRFVPASTVTGTITVTFTNTLNGAMWSVAEIASGFDSGGTNGSAAITQSNVASTASGSTSITVTLAAFANAGSVGYGVFATDTDVDIVPANGYTELFQNEGSAPVRSLQHEYLAGDADPSVTYTASYGLGIGVEIREEAAAGSKAFPFMVQPLRLWKLRR